MPESRPPYPRLFPPPSQTIAGLGRALREGRTTCVEILKGCLAQVEEWEPKVHAWVVLDREGSLRQAQALDEELKAGKDRGPLHGIPIGIKDIIDVEGMPTGCGAKRWAERIATDDADVVETLRGAGAVIMGKTVTTAYASLDPSITRNPWNLERTPGGSSSGSAAAVATGMCLGALGSQTGGSITRPASFCGVAGMKPSRYMVKTDGVFPLAPSMDHVGPIARTVDDLLLLFRVIRRYSSEKEAPDGNSQSREAPPRLGRLRGFFDRRADPVVRTAVDEVVRELEQRGAKVIELEDPVDFNQVLADHGKVVIAEATAAHSDWLDDFPDDYPARIRGQILEGRSLTAFEYLRAKGRMIDKACLVVGALMREQLNALITPATATTAPDRSSTGDPAFNAPWSYTGLPTVSFPIGLASDGLPVAIQIIGYHVHDQELLRDARWCEQAIRTSRQ
jgi:Asp-tRNA(Asn)/Glu-tRNA(Gln) amidotransferase A subunit family amidase